MRLVLGKKEKNEKVLVKREERVHGGCWKPPESPFLLINFSYSMPHIVLEMAPVCNHGLYAVETSPHVPFIACIRCFILFFLCMLNLMSQAVGIRDPYHK